MALLIPEHDQDNGEWCGFSRTDSASGQCPLGCAAGQQPPPLLAPAVRDEGEVTYQPWAGRRGAVGFRVTPAGGPDRYLYLVPSEVGEHPRACVHQGRHGDPEKDAPVFYVDPLEAHAGARGGALVTAIPGDQLIRRLSPHLDLVVDASACIVLRTPASRHTVGNVAEMQDALGLARIEAQIRANPGEATRSQPAGLPQVPIPAPRPASPADAEPEARACPAEQGTVSSQDGQAARSSGSAHAAKIDNRTFGEIDRNELAGMHENARPCTRCGMVATVDPIHHEERYGHAPQIESGNGHLTWSAASLQWLPTGDLTAVSASQCTDPGADLELGG
jgi:hypothetical protein